jgi:hypothetical protein
MHRGGKQAVERCLVFPNRDRPEATAKKVGSIAGAITTNP